MYPENPITKPIKYILLDDFNKLSSNEKEQIIKSLKYENEYLNEIYKNILIKNDIDKTTINLK